MYFTLLKCESFFCRSKDSFRYTTLSIFKCLEVLSVYKCDKWIRINLRISLRGKIGRLCNVRGIITWRERRAAPGRRSSLLTFTPWRSMDFPLVPT